MSQSLFSRRGAMRAASIASGFLLLSDTRAQGVGGQDADIETSTSLWLQSEEVFAFISDKKQTQFTATVQTPPYYQAHAKPLQLGQVIEPGTSGEHQLMGAIERIYTVRRTVSGLHTKVPVVVPVQQMVKIFLTARLFTKQGLDVGKRDRVIQAFDDFKPGAPDTVSGQINALMAQHGVAGDEIVVRLAWRLEKVEPRVEIRAAEIALLALYNVDLIDPTSKKLPVPRKAFGPIGDSKFYEYPPTWKVGEVEVGERTDIKLQLAQKHGIRIVADQIKVGQTYQMDERILRRLPAPQTANPLFLEPRPGQLKVAQADLDAALERAHDIAANLNGCEYIKKESFKHRLAVLFSVPEFKVDWREKRLRVGCAWVSISLPHLQYRYSRLTIFSYVVNVKGVPSALLASLKECLEWAFLSGAAAGLVLSNFAAATETFRIVFHECIRARKESFVKCLIPQLAVEMEVDGGWTDV